MRGVEIESYVPDIIFFATIITSIYSEKKFIFYNNGSQYAARQDNLDGMQMYLKTKMFYFLNISRKNKKSRMFRILLLSLLT